MEKQENIQQKKNISKAVVLVPHNGKLHKNRRYGKGVVIALSRIVKKVNKFTYHVESEIEDNKFYVVMFKPDNGPSSCTCADYENHKDQVFLCKHMYALMILITIAENTIIDETDKKQELTTKPVQETTKTETKESNKYIVESWRNDKYDF